VANRPPSPHCSATLPPPSLTPPPRTHARRPTTSSAPWADGRRARATQRRAATQQAGREAAAAACPSRVHASARATASSHPAPLFVSGVPDRRSCGPGGGQALRGCVGRPGTGASASRLGALASSSALGRPHPVQQRPGPPSSRLPRPPAGVYVATERVSVSPHRVNVRRMDPNKDLSGGRGLGGPGRAGGRGEGGREAGTQTVFVRGSRAHAQ
jgi:hypothetical protein